MPVNTGICPPGMEHKAGDVAKYLLELLKLAPSSLMGVAVPLEVLLGAATLEASTTYRVPADFNLVVFQMQPMYRSTALATEPVLNANITSLDLAGLTEARLQNVLAQLALKDRKLDVIEGASLNLASILRYPAKWPENAPLIVPAAQTLEATFSVQDATAAVVGQNAYYGLLLTGVLIPVSI